MLSKSMYNRAFKKEYFSLELSFMKNLTVFRSFLQLPFLNNKKMAIFQNSCVKLIFKISFKNI